MKIQTDSRVLELVASGIPSDLTSEQVKEILENRNILREIIRAVLRSDLSQVNLFELFEALKIVPTAGQQYQAIIREGKLRRRAALQSLVATE